MEQEQELPIDIVKIRIDFLKHATSLATGSIVVVATFFDKFPKPLVNAGLLIMAMALLVMSLLCAWLEMGALVFVSGFSSGYKAPKETSGLIKLTLLGFYGGTTSLGLFAIANIIYRVYISK